MNMGENMPEEPRILIVDDEPKICHFLEVLLRREGYRVGSVLNGADATMLIEKGGYEMVITDLKMPGMDGFQLIKRLDALGYLVKTGRKIAFTGKLTGNIKLLGAVQAGFPSPAEEELVDTLSLDEFLIERPEATFMLKVTGDSMIEAGIHPDDMVLIEKGPSPKTGDIVIACVDGEWTMKYFIRDRTGIHLDPANPKYEPIRPENTLEIAGIVKTVIRKY